MPAPPVASNSPVSTPPELAAARDAAVVCDLSPLSVLAISGPDAAKFLHGQLSSDVEDLAEDAWHYTSLNSPKGRILANFVLWRDAASEFRALVPAELAEAIDKRLSMYVLRSKVTLTDISAATSRFGIGGPGARQAVTAALGSAPALLALARIGASTVLALPGTRFVAIAPVAVEATLGERLESQALRAGFSVWQWLTIRAGIPVVTARTQDQFVAQAANWDVLNGVNFRKGCYTGQEIIARMQYLGRLKERLFLLHAEAGAPEPGTRIFGATFGDSACGTVVNAAPAPGGGSDLLAVVQLASLQSGDLHLGSASGPPLAVQPLPYDVPAPETPRGRIGPSS
jgi:tRNA-modifying protein YgfZ